VYSIPAKQKLTLREIADHWSGEIQPRMEPSKVLHNLVKAWWRGELIVLNGPSRAEMLRVLYKLYQDRIGFLASGLEEPVSSKVLPDVVANRTAQLMCDEQHDAKTIAFRREA
jgi:hypothetical protein